MKPQILDLYWPIKLNGVEYWVNGTYEHEGPSDIYVDIESVYLDEDRTKEVKLTKRELGELESYASQEVYERSVAHEYEPEYGQDR